MLESELSMIQTGKAIKRLSTGTHIPHPEIKYKRVKYEQFSFMKKMNVQIDGKKIGKFSNISFRVENEALREVI